MFLTLEIVSVFGEHVGKTRPFTGIHSLHSALLSLVYNNLRQSGIASDSPSVPPRAYLLSRR